MAGAVHAAGAHLHRVDGKDLDRSVPGLRGKPGCDRSSTIIPRGPAPITATRYGVVVFGTVT
jgi:hypothetical protein